MRVKALLTTHEEIAVSPTEKPLYNKVDSKYVKQNIDTPTASVVSKMISDKGKAAAMEAAVSFSNSLKTTEAQKKAVMSVAESEIGYVQPESSFEEKLAQKLKGEKKNASENSNAFSPKKNAMSPK